VRPSTRVNGNDGKVDPMPSFSAIAYLVARDR
jgi:hypothetical protein